ncbi:MAG: zinc dependent phospholipase C family protein [Chloroflexota bacterium]
MPTPFMHLQVAERIRAHSNLKDQIRDQLRLSWPAFYLGSVAADFQTISDVPREVTHFYRLPPQRDVRAHEVMLDEYPQLADARELDNDHAVFIAAYRAHLLLDLCWYWRVLTPFFIEASGWSGDHRQRFLAHNTLLTYLDKQAYDALPHDAGDTLARATPEQWLPFAGDGDLIRWRDMLVQQLEPGAQLQTTTIYAERLQMTAEEFSARIEEPQWMSEQVFDKVPLGRVKAIISEGMEQSIPLIEEYLKRTT